MAEENKEDVVYIACPGGLKGFTDRKKLIEEYERQLKAAKEAGRFNEVVNLERKLKELE